MSQRKLTAKFRPVGPEQDDKKTRDVAASIQTVTSPRRRRQRRAVHAEDSVGWNCTRITAGQEMQYDAVSGGRMPIESQDAIDQAMKTVDVLSQYAKDQSCSPDQRRQVFALKNMVMLLLWRQKPEMYVGMWKHTSIGTDMMCWACKGTGDKEGTLEACPRCHGTCIHRRTGTASVFSVFAVQGGTYATTWHLPSIVVDRLLGVVTYGHDLVAEHTWPAYDLRKIPASLDANEYEYHRSYLAWFVTRSSG